MFGFVNTVSLVSGKRAGGTCGEGSWASLRSPTGSNPCPVGARRGTARLRVLRAVSSRGRGRLRVLFITCCTRALQEGWGFLKPSVSVMFSGILHLCPKERESSRRRREPLPHGPGPLPGSTKERFDWRAHSRASQSLSALCT